VSSTEDGEHTKVLVGLFVSDGDTLIVVQGAHASSLPVLVTGPLELCNDGLLLFQDLNEQNGQK
jgi:hypothetical protein